MKNLILTLTVAALAVAPITLRAEDPKPERPKREGGAGGPGGPSGGRMNPEERLKKMTEMLTLTQEQQDKVKAIMESGREEFGKLKDLPEDQRREKMREAFQQQNEKILAVLTPEQQEKYKTAMAERMKQGGDRKPGEGRKPGDRKPEGGPKPEGGAKPEEKK
jgi:Spy/CpxP family protein refolding chaperone